MGARPVARGVLTPHTSRYTTIQTSPIAGAMIRNGWIALARSGDENAARRSTKYDGGDNEDDAQRSGEEPRLEGEIPEQREPQAKEDLRGEGPKVLDRD